MSDDEIRELIEYSLRNLTHEVESLSQKVWTLQTAIDDLRREGE